MHQFKTVGGSWSYIFLLKGFDEHVLVEGQEGQILRIQMVDRLLKDICPFKRPNSLLEGAHCTKLKRLEGVRVIFFCYRVEMNMSW